MKNQLHSMSGIFLDTCTYHQMSALVPNLKYHKMPALVPNLKYHKMPALAPNLKYHKMSALVPNLRYFTYHKMSATITYTNVRYISYIPGIHAAVNVIHLTCNRYG